MKVVLQAFISLSLILLPLSAKSQEPAYESIEDTTALIQEEQPKKIGLIRRIIRGFDRLDTAYIEPQHYLFTVMLQGTYTYDYYTLRSGIRDGQSISFANDGMVKLGPYVGWKWFFGGYAFTLGHSTYDKTKTEIDLSLYSSQIGIDLFYRRTGSDYKLRNVHIKDQDQHQRFEDLPFDGLKVGVAGADLYYIFNHGHFSYPAAFAQSTCQKISCGSWLAGIGFTHNSLDFDYDKLQKLLDENIPEQEVKLDSGFMFKTAEYYNIGISGGYAYNWVFAKNWLLSGSGQVAVAYKQSKGKTEEKGEEQQFSLTKISPYFIGRFGLVYNNTKWYAGLSAIVHSNYYLESRFATNNTFGSMNLYVGYNFGLKKKYKDKK